MKKLLLTIFFIFIYYLGAFSQLKKLIQTGHLGILTSVQFSPDGKKVLTTSEDGTAKIWNAQNGVMLIDLKGPNDNFLKATFSRNGEKIVTSSYDNRTIKIWDAKTGLLLKSIIVPKNTAKDIGYFDSNYAIFNQNGNLLFTKASNSFPKIWNVKTGALLFDLKGLIDTDYEASTISTDGKILISVSNSKFINELNKNGQIVESKLNYDSVKIWDIQTKKMINKGLFNNNYLAFLTDSIFLTDAQIKKLILKPWNGKIDYSIDLVDMRFLDSIKQLSNWTMIKYSPDRLKMIICTSGFNDIDTASIWDTRTLTLLVRLKGYHCGEEFLFSPNGKIGITLESSNLGLLGPTSVNLTTARLWDLETGLQISQINSFFCGSFTFSPDSKKLAIGEGGRTKIFDTKTGKLLIILKGQYRPKILSTYQTKLMLKIGHTDKIKSLSFSSDGKRFITASDDQTAKIWDTESGLVLTDLIGHRKSVTAASFSPDNKKVYTLSEDNTVKIWDSNSGRMVNDFKYLDGKIVDAEIFNQNINLKINFNKEVLDNKEVLESRDTETSEILYSTYIQNQNNKKKKRGGDYTRFLSPNGKTILDFIYPSDMDEPKSAQLHDSKTDTILNSEIGGIKDATMAKFSPDGKIILVTSFRGIAKLTDGQTGAVLVDLKVNEKFISSSFSSDSKRLVIACLDSNESIGLTIYDVATGSIIIKTIVKDLIYVYDITFSNDGNKILINKSNGPTKILDSNTGRLLMDFENQKDKYDELWFSKDSKKIIGSTDRTFKIWDIRTGNLITNLKTDSNDVFNHCFLSPDEKKIVTLGERNGRIWDAQTGNLLFDLNRNIYKLKNVSFSADGNKIIAEKENNIRSYNINGLLKSTNESNPHHFVSYNDNFTKSIFSPDGKKLAKITNDTSVYIQDAKTDSILLKLKGDAGRIESISFSRNCKKIITASWYNRDYINEAKPIINIEDAFFELNSKKYSKKNRIRFGIKNTIPVNMPIVPISTDAPITPVSINTNSIDTNLYIPSNLDSIAKVKILTGTNSFYTKIKVWDLQTGELLNSFKKDTNRIENAILSPDEKKITIISRTDTIKILDAKTGSILSFLKPNTKNVSAISYSKDSNRLVTLSSDGNVSTFDVKTGSLLVKLKNLNSNVINASFSPDGKYILTGSENNNCKIWNAANGKLLFSIIPLNDVDYLVTDPYGRYDCSTGASKLIYFTHGNKIIKNSKLKDELRVPSLATKIMKSNKINVRKL